MKFSPYIFTFILIAGCSILGFSQNIIRGKVVDANSGEAIAFADILIVGQNKGTTTDLDGFYSLNGLPLVPIEFLQIL
ncbi:MAG TPA: carboxypeptidase-like regulatory domain-containing protein [Saprospiraceae bacterium]|nr:carboxypeptidase-like regulatory domain-containing protein [Saprospiraceae bacterium]